MSQFLREKFVYLLPFIRLPWQFHGFFWNLSKVYFLFCRLLDKLLVTCPNADSCQEQLQRGNLADHLRYRCPGTLVACQYAASGCDYRGPSKSMAKHQTECRFKKEGKTIKVENISNSIGCSHFLAFMEYLFNIWSSFSCSVQLCIVFLICASGDWHSQSKQTKS